MSSYRDLREKAAQAVARGDYEEAHDLVTAMRHYFRRDFEADLLEGQIHMERGRLGDARAAFEAVLEVDPENVVARTALGIVLGEQGKLDAALEQLERAFDLDPTNRQIADEISRVHSRLDHTTTPEPGSPMHVMARRLSSRRRYDRSIPLFEEARFFAPKAVEIAVGLAQALWVTRRAAEAATVAREIQQAHPNCLKALAILAGSAFSEGDERWNKLLRETGNLNPGNDYARTLFMEGGLVFPEIDREVELTEGESGEELPPPQEVVPSREVVLSRERAPSPETRLFDAIAALEPNSQGDDAVHGGILARLQATLSEEVDGSRGTGGPVEKPGDADLHVSFARSFAARGQFDLALDEYRIALKLNMGIAGDVAEAARVIVDADPDNLGAKLLVGDSLSMDGRFREAVEHYISAMNKSKREGNGTHASHSQA